MGTGKVYGAEGAGALMLVIVIFFFMRSSPWWLAGALLGFYLPLGVTVGFNRARHQDELTGSQSFVWLIASIITWALLVELLGGRMFGYFNFNVGTSSFLGISLSTISAGALAGAGFGAMCALLNFFGLRKLFSFDFWKSNYAPTENKSTILEKIKLRKKFKKAIKELPKDQRKCLMSLYDSAIASDKRTSSEKAELRVLMKIAYICFQLEKRDPEEFKENDFDYKFKGKDKLKKLGEKGKKTKLESELTKAYADLKKIVDEKHEQSKANQKMAEKISESLKERKEATAKSIKAIAEYSVKASEIEQELVEKMGKEPKGTVEAVLKYVWLLWNSISISSNSPQPGEVLNSDLLETPEIIALLPEDLVKDLETLKSKNLLRLLGSKYYKELEKANELIEELAKALKVEDIDKIKKDALEKIKKELEDAIKAGKEVKKEAEKTESTKSEVKEVEVPGS